MSDRFHGRKGSAPNAGEPFSPSVLVEENTKFRELIRLSEDWYWEVDKNLQYTYSSPQIFQILGYTPEEIIGKYPYSFMTNEEAHRVAKISKPLIKQRKSINHSEFCNIHKNGQKVYMRSNAEPVFDEEGKFRGYRGIDKDITVDKYLKQEINTLNQIISQMNEAALILDKDLNITYLNETFYDLFGYRPKDILEKSITELGPPAESEAVSPEQVIQALDEEDVWEGETKRRKKNGKYISVYLRARTIRSEEGEITGYLGTYIDLSPFKKSEKKIRKSLLATITAISATVEKRDPYTYGHQNRVTSLAVAIAKEMGLPKDFVRGLQMGSMIHDIGKIYIPSEILNRPGKISEHEFGMIKTHSQVGFDIVQDIVFPWPVSDMILQHHERLDGSGYPNKLIDDQILKEAKFIAVADVYEAMTSHRPYRPALDKNKGLDELERNRGNFYDPEIVDCCLSLVRNNQFTLF